MTSQHTHPPVAPLGLVHIFTFINSLGTGLVTSGITFITKQGLGFSREANFVLALVIGITYIIGAAGASRFVRTLKSRFSLSSRGVLALLMILLAALCTLPFLAASMLGGRVPAWTIWVLVCLYSPLTGVLWPVIESFLSGGRSGAALRSALGQWNIVWSSALIVAYWAAAPLLEDHPTIALLGLGSTHIVALTLLRAMPAEPAAHIHEHHAPAPPEYARLLSVFRVLLPASYVVSSALGPMLPEVLARFPITPMWQVWLATSWLIARPITFFVLARWGAWHGSWAHPVAAAILLLIGFAASATASRIDTGGLGLALQIVGLFVFGVGMSSTYAGAIYYAMEVGQAEVDAGGTHEALIGLGYTVGPACGLIASGFIAAGSARETAFEPIVLVLVAAIVLTALGWGFRVAKRSAPPRSS